MRWSTHALIGAATGSTVAFVSGSEAAPLMAIGGVFGVLPDVDLVLSGISKNVHRSTATHSLLGASLITSAWLMAHFCLGTLFGPGWSSALPLDVSSLTVFASAFLHAASDAASLMGCRALYPLSRRRFRGPVRYDDWAANAALAVVAVGVILMTNADLSGLLQ